MPSANSNINWRRNQIRPNATADKISNPNPNRLFGTRRHNKKPHNDPNTTKLLHQSNTKMQTITIAGIEITLKLNKKLKSIDITCCQLGDIHGDVNTIFGDVNTVDGTVNLNVTGDVLGEVLSNIIYKSEIHLKGKIK